MLTTCGGSGDSAYRIARCLQRSYRDGEFILFVDSLCKSAGTLIALGSDQIIMSDGSELGPLDVQVSKHGEVGEYSSGLTASQTFNTLRVATYSLFDEHFKKLRYTLRFPTKLAAETAARIVTGLFRPIYGQIDPIRLGENERAMMIAKHYGERISENTENLVSDTLNRLLVRYPSHEFVIDREEAQTLFSSVREPTEAESCLANEVSDLVMAGQQRDIKGEGAMILAISEKRGLPDADNNTGGNEHEAIQESGMASAAGGTGSNRVAGNDGQGVVHRNARRRSQKSEGSSKGDTP